MDLPSEDVFILLELPELTPPSESASMSEDSLSVSVKCLFLLTAWIELPLLLLLGLELLHDKSVGSRGGDGDDTDMGRGDGRRNLGCRC